VTSCFCGAQTPWISRTRGLRAHRIVAASTRVRFRQYEAPPGDGAGRVAERRESEMDTIIERCAGLDIGKKTR
jgi:hypothetical protein